VYVYVDVVYCHVTNICRASALRVMSRVDCGYLLLLSLSSLSPSLSPAPLPLSLSSSLPLSLSPSLPLSLYIYTRRQRVRVGRQYVAAAWRAAGTRQRRQRCPLSHQAAAGSLRNSHVLLSSLFSYLMSEYVPSSLCISLPPSRSLRFAACTRTPLPAATRQLL
jgi:hypothetical protein